MLSTESWDNCEKPPLLFPFTALTCDETPVFSGSVLNLVAHSVDNTALADLSSTRNERCDRVTNYSFSLLKLHVMH